MRGCCSAARWPWDARPQCRGGRRSNGSCRRWSTPFRGAWASPRFPHGSTTTSRPGDNSPRPGVAEVTASVSAVRRFSNLPAASEVPPVVHSSLPESRSFRYSFKGLLHAPASGYRQYATGDLTNVGTQGDFWSSSPGAAGNTNAGGMWFHDSNVNPEGGTERAYAFTVRCVQHLRAVKNSRSPQRRPGAVI